MNDAAILVAVVGFFCLALALMAALADWIESDDQRDARSRNHVSRPK